MPITPILRKQNPDSHIRKWELNVVRTWFDPYWGYRDVGSQDPFPPTAVNMAVEFEDEKSALAFEVKVRELLEAS